MWLGNKKGYFQDWLTQQWVKVLGRKINPERNAWLIGPKGDTRLINDAYIHRIAKEENLRLEKDKKGFGLMESMKDLDFDEADYAHLSDAVIDFYEHTFDYEFEIWSEWSGLYKPFGWLIRMLFSRRLQQLNLPMNPIDSSRGIESHILKLKDKTSHETKYTIWYRILKAKNEVIYSGVYNHVFLPDKEETMVKVAFPLPNGNGSVIMEKSVLEDGSFRIESKGKKFGDAGFYFYLTDGKGKHWAKYLKAMHEYIHVYEAANELLRADHVLSLYGRPFLKLHYKMKRKG